MPVAFVLVNTELGLIEEVLDKLLLIDEVVEAYSVAGPYAIAAKVETDTFEKLARVIPEKIHTIESITKTLTLSFSEPHGSSGSTHAIPPKSSRNGEK